MRLTTLALAAAALTPRLSAQQAAEPVTVPPPITDNSPFRRLELPTPGSVRAGSGAPGPDYWQQRADYVIRATLDTVARSVSGAELIGYTNNSPDTLRYLWLQLDQNLFRNGSKGALIFDPNSRFGTGGAQGGFSLTRVAEASPRVAKGQHRLAPRDLPYTVNETMMRIDLARPLPPKGKVSLDIAWSFPFGTNSNRMGVELVDGDYVFETAQWYPRLAVYDDVRGWNTEQYLGQGEFYLEYGKFDVSLTVPANLLVAATGVLQNPLVVLTATQRARLVQARKSDSTITIRGMAEIDDPASRPGSASGMLTWHFTADSVRDFAWAAARHFIWDAARINGGKTLAMSFYPPSADSIWNQSTQYTKTAIENYSSQWFVFPYPIANNINGIEGGMEYPMIVFCHNRTNPQALYSVTDHEFGHTWFPMVVGNNERLYPWMDEGFNTFMNYYNWEKKYPGTPNRRGSIGAYLQAELSGRAQPIMTPADRQVQLGQGGYNKPGLALRTLRDHVVGAARFDPAFQEYIRRWAFKHPTPADFFRSMEDGLGEDLSWFWRSWFYSTETLDQAVDSLAVVTDSGGQLSSHIFLSSPGPMVMPVELRLGMEDGTTMRLSLPVEVWYFGSHYTAVVPGPQRVATVMVDPDSVFADVNRGNNTFPRVVN